MLIETNAEQVEDFTLEEVRARPDRRKRIDVGIGPGEPDLQSQILLISCREKLVDDFEARLAGIPVEAGDVGQRVVLQLSDRSSA